MRRFFPLFGFLVIFFSTSPVWARATSASTQLYYPVVDDSRYFSLYSSQTFQPLQFRFGLAMNYARRPAEIGIGGTRRLGLVDNLVMGDFFGSLGVLDWLQLGLDIPVAFLAEVNDIATATSSSTAAMGDIRFLMKGRLLNIDRHSVGVSLLPFIHFPTGSGSKFVGNNSFSGGADLIVDFDIKQRVQIATNLGYHTRDRTTVSQSGLSFNTIQDDTFNFGLGVNWSIKDWVELVGEFTGATLTSDFFGREVEIPLEVGGGAKFFPTNVQGLELYLGGKIGLTFGYGAPDFRILAGVSYPTPRKVKLPPPPEPIAYVEEDKIVITRRVHFEFNKAVIRPVSFQILDAVAEVLKKSPYILKVRVEGHTDFVGSDSFNMRLSQQRADAVQKHLIDKGISRERLVAVGYGETRPIDPDKTDLARARNRRVEFTILEQNKTQP